MDAIHMFLSPQTSLSKIIERSETIMNQMKRPVDTLPCGYESVCPMFCQVCGNIDEQFTVTDDAQAMIICLGYDGRGCGNVLQESMMRAPFTYTHHDENPFELFSPQADFKSELYSTNHKSQRINKMVEANLNRFGRDDTVTSDQYKDKQRKEAYSLLDQVCINTDINVDLVNQVKMLFHHYRTRMYRIHKLEVALLALFYIVLNNKL
jgi:hypothetical protein